MTSVKTFAWLTLLLPLAGCVVNGLGYRVLRGRTPGYVGTGAEPIARTREWSDGPATPRPT